MTVFLLVGSIYSIFSPISAYSTSRYYSLSQVYSLLCFCPISIICYLCLEPLDLLTSLILFISFLFLTFFLLLLSFFICSHSIFICFLVSATLKSTQLIIRIAANICLKKTTKKSGWLKIFGNCSC